MNARPRTPDTQALETRLALRIAGSLNEDVARLAPDVAERLRFAREQALERARQTRLASAAAVQPVGRAAGGVAVLGAFAPWLQRAAAVLPLLVLVGGLALIQQFSSRERVLAAAEIDAQLLSDDLPPSAYSDPGFAEFLRADPPLQ